MRDMNKHRMDNRLIRMLICVWFGLGLGGCYTPFVTSIAHNQYVLPTLPVLAFAAGAVFASGSSTGMKQASTRSEAVESGHDVPRPMRLRARRPLSRTGS